VAGKRPDHAQHPVPTLTLSQLDALLTTYREALRELRSWHDSRVGALIVKLEALQLQASRERRYLIESERAARRL
jgi:hypothetical protein